MPQLGPSFGDDLRSAGLMGLPISWGEDGVFGLENLPADKRAEVEAVIATHEPSAPSAGQVNLERDRRLKTFAFGGKSYDFVDGKGSDINIAGAGTLALAAIIAGKQPNDLRWSNPDVDFYWIAADNSTVTMDAQTCLSFAQAAAAWKARHIYAARIIKDMTPIPSDYADNSRW